MKYLKRFIYIYLCLVANIASANVVLTSKGAWTEKGIVPTSNADQQENHSSLTRNQFNRYGGPVICLNAKQHWLDMETTDQNPHQNYTAGNTYHYQTTAVAHSEQHSTQQIAMLLADGEPITGTLITGPNNSGIYGEKDKKTITGSFTVNPGDSVIGKQIGIRLSSAGVQTRFISTDPTFVSVKKSALSNGANGEKILFASDFEKHSSGKMILDVSKIEGIELSFGFGGRYISQSGGYLRINNNATTIQSVSLLSKIQRFKKDCIYQITFNASQPVANDPQQNQLRISVGTYTTEFTIPNKSKTFAFDVSSNDKGIAGELFKLQFSAAAPTTTGIKPNQYRIESLKIIEKNSD